MNDHETFMRVALEEARLGLAEGEQPFGAVVVFDGEIICRTRSLKVAKSDSTAHAESLAISTATKLLKKRLLPGFVLYATCEPCPMCIGAIFNADIQDIVIGARLRDLKGAAFKVGTYSVERFAAMVDWTPRITSGVLSEECMALYNDSAVPLSR